jgi:hypothetical protein
MERLPFDVIAHLLSGAARCSLTGWELLQLRLVSKLWLRACDSPAVVRAWRATSSDYVVWQVRTCRWQPPWPANAPAVAEVVRQVSRSTNYGRALGATPGGLALLYWAVCESLVWSLRNGQTCAPFFTGVRGRDDDSDDSDYVDEPDEDLQAQDAQDDAFAPEYQDFAEQKREELKLDEEAMPASWNYLHWACSSMMALQRCSQDDGSGMFDVHLDEVLRGNWTELADERCCVTGMTPLLALMTDCDEGVVYPNVDLKPLESLVQLLTGFGASLGARDKLGRGAVELYWRNNWTCHKPFQQPAFLHGCPSFEPPLFSSEEMVVYLPSSEVAQLLERAQMDVGSEVVRTLFMQSLSDVVQAVVVATQHDRGSLIREHNVLHVLPFVLKEYAGRLN